MAETVKSLEDNFRDWESQVFGFGYGTGEPLILPVLKQFMERIPTDGGYDYQELEREVGAVVAWLFINVLARADILEYGASPRFAWLTKEGRALKAFLGDHTAEELVTLTHLSEDYVHCYPDACNCGPHGYEEGRVCVNPFWVSKILRRKAG